MTKLCEKANNDLPGATNIEEKALDGAGKMNLRTFMVQRNTHKTKLNQTNKQNPPNPIKNRAEQKSAFNFY